MGADRVTTTHFKSRQRGFTKRWLLLPGALLLASVAAAWADDGPTALEVSGVRLGMTPNEAADALKAFDPAFAVTRKYLYEQFTSFGQEGNPLESLVPAARATAYLNVIVAAKGTAKRDCNFNGYCDVHYPEDVETVKVWFSRVPGGEHVIAVQREKHFQEDRRPPVASLKADILAKYPEPQTTFAFRGVNQEVIGWLFGPKGQLLSPAAARNRHLLGTGGLPQSVKAGDGIGLDADFSSPNNNAGIAEGFTLALFNADGLYSSVEQAKQAYRALKAKADAQEIEGAQRNGSPTKF